MIQRERERRVRHPKEAEDARLLFAREALEERLNQTRQAEKQKQERKNLFLKWRIPGFFRDVIHEEKLTDALIVWKRGCSAVILIWDMKYYPPYTEDHGGWDGAATTTDYPESYKWRHIIASLSSKGDELTIGAGDRFDLLDGDTSTILQARELKLGDLEQAIASAYLNATHGDIDFSILEAPALKWRELEERQKDMRTAWLLAEGRLWELLRSMF